MKRISSISQTPSNTPFVLFRTVRMALAFLILMVLPYTLIHAGTVEKIYPVDVWKWGPELKGIRYFLGRNTTYGLELWRTDGTRSGTWMVKDTISGDSGLHDSTRLITDGSYLYFLDGALYRSDGTESGTELLISSEFYCVALNTVGNKIYLPCDLNGDTNFEMYRLDGEGLTLIKERAIFVGNSQSRWGDWGRTGASPSGLFFFTDEPNQSYSRKLWKIKPDGSVSLMCAESGRDSLCTTTNDGNTIAANGKLWWESLNSIVANGSVVKDLDYAQYSGFSNGRSAEFQNQLFFGGPGLSSQIYTRIPWLSDGTSLGTVPLLAYPQLDIVAEGAPSVVGVSSTQLFFAMPTLLPTGKEIAGLWVTDGTNTGTHLVTTEFHARFGEPFGTTEVFDSQGRSYFRCSTVAVDPFGGESVCRSNGTDAGTDRMSWGNFYPIGPAPVNGRLMFGAANVPGPSPEESGYYLLAINPNGPSMQDIQVSVIGSGRVQSDIAGIDCGADCSESFDGGSWVTMTAIPDAGETFIGWEGVYGWGMDCIATSTTCNLYMNLDHQMTARFSPNTYVVTPEASSFGSISPSIPQIVNSGETASFAVTPDSGFNVYEAIGCDGALEGTTYTTGVINQDCIVSVSFMPTDTTCTTGNAKVGPATYLDGEALAELAEGTLNTVGNVMLESGARVVYAATTSVELNKGFRAMVGSMLSAQTRTVECE